MGDFHSGVALESTISYSEEGHRRWIQHRFLSLSMSLPLLPPAWVQCFLALSYLGNTRECCIINHDDRRPVATRQDDSRLDWTRQSSAVQDKTGRNSIRQGSAVQDKTELDKVEQYRTGKDWTGLDRVVRYRQDWTGLDWTGLNSTR
jgi:hypothetical protein